MADSLAGLHLVDLVHQNDRAKLENIYSSTPSSEELQPVLVTCYAQSASEHRVFDTEKQISFCLQKQGELRSDFAESASPESAG
eukprot:CAMPEP_0180555640 /NCGR_PEP_ID=MMETSP1037_2-20121125/89_1 /TAXON_ID=632150 /ORGANISM="Azadinium spinosum, Strain 3D9" /LENGTH=83 /DNA_ID=CAMNT_0022571495 /DNA_START=615 /DNA_END=862 /DNA_ORIENTATION=+